MKLTKTVRSRRRSNGSSTSTSSSRGRSQHKNICDSSCNSTYQSLPAAMNPETTSESPSGPRIATNAGQRISRSAGAQPLVERLIKSRDIRRLLGMGNFKWCNDIDMDIDVDIDHDRRSEGGVTKTNGSGSGANLQLSIPMSLWLASPQPSLSSIFTGMQFSDIFAMRNEQVTAGNCTQRHHRSVGGGGGGGAGGGGGGGSSNSSSSSAGGNGRSWCSYNAYSITNFNPIAYAGDLCSCVYLIVFIMIYYCILIHASEMPGQAIAATTSLSSASGIVAIEARILERQSPIKRDANQNVPEFDDEDYDSEYDEYDALINNKSAKGKYIGAPCDNMKCDATLLHVTCDNETQTCGCEKTYPVQLGLIKGCAKPRKLGEQCFYDETCMYTDENSLCIQVRHNALCQCANGFHLVSYTKPRKVFCTPDLKELERTDLPTLLGVTAGIAMLAGLICMVLHLFSKSKYPRHRNFANANPHPPILYSNDTGIPISTYSGRPSSRSSIRSSGSISSYSNRRSSTGDAISGGGGGHGGGGHGGGGGGGSGSSVVGGGGGHSGSVTGGTKGILVSTSRTGSRRPSLASVHSTSSSVRSYSMMRFKKECEQREIRQEMKLRLALLQQQQHLNPAKRSTIIIGDTLSLHDPSTGRISIVTPSPITPHSTDDLLPAVDETQEVSKIIGVLGYNYF